MNIQESESKKYFRVKERRNEILNKKIDNDFVEMNKRINKLTKWSRFKEKREQIIDAYTKIKKK
jgi:hypothetical protein